MGECPYCRSLDIVEYMGDYMACNDCRQTWKPLDAIDRANHGDDIDSAF
jgi:hypothetical protein